MRFTSMVMCASMLVCLCGCSIRAKKRIPPPPPPQPTAPAPAVPVGPLSIPQTRVELPPSQPLDPHALDVGQQEPPAPAPAETAPAPKPVRKPAPAPAPATTGPQPQPEAPPPAAPVEERPRLQEIVSPEEKRRLAEEIAVRKREINEVLAQATRRGLSDQERAIVERIRSFVQLSDQAAARGEMRQAEGLSERALVLARELVK